MNVRGGYSRASQSPRRRPAGRDWRQVSRRTDLESKIDGHLEYARFLKFVRQNIVRKRRYRLALSDMSLLEIMPKGRYW